MKESSIKSNPEKTYKPFHIAHGNQAEIPLNAVIIGGGNACYNLLKILDNERLSRLKMNILGVSDLEADGPGFCYAKELGLFTSTTPADLIPLPGLNLIIELTPSAKLREEIFALKPANVSILDHNAVRLIWELFQAENEKLDLEREQRKNELRTKKHTQIILDSLPFRIMVVNMDLTVYAVNKAFLEEFNYGPEDIEGKHCYELRYQLDKPCRESGRICYLEEKREIIKKEGIFRTIRELSDDKGNTHFDDINLAPIFDEEGRLVQIVEASRDITERVKLEQELQKSNVFFQNVIRSTVDGIVVVDTQGNVLIFNEGMERLTGNTAKEIGHLRSFYNIDVAKENMKKMRSDQFGPVGKLHPTEMSVTTVEGEKIPVTLSASIITIEGEEVGSVGVFTDMREILKMRKDLEEAHIQLVQSEKIASVGRMAAGVAHEINNPLSGLLIYAELLQESLREDPDKAGDIEEIITQTLRCKKIVAELLEFSRQSVGKVSSFSLKYLITKCLNLLVNQAIFQNIQVTIEIEPDMPEMVGDMGQLQQVFTNLFINAAHAMETGGKLDLRALFDPHKAQFMIKVSDTGPGIPIDSRDKIFDIFFTTKPVGTGTGLGLSISQNIIKLHGGSITFECPEQGGTVFTIELPLEFSEVPSTEEPVFIGMD